MSLSQERGEERRGSKVEAQDESRLAELGYRQELNRDWSLVHNFGVSFSIIVSLLYHLSSRPTMFDTESASQPVVPCGLWLQILIEPSKMVLRMELPPKRLCTNMRNTIPTVNDNESDLTCNFPERGNGHYYSI